MTRTLKALAERITPILGSTEKCGVQSCTGR